MTPQEIVLADIKAERDRQDAKWGDQSNSRDGTGADVQPMYEMGRVSSLTSARSLAWKATNQTDVESRRPGGASMASILLEEMFEALAEDEADKLRTELIQVAAVATAWCEYLDRRGARP